MKLELAYMEVLRVLKFLPVLLHTLGQGYDRAGGPQGDHV